MFLGKIKFFSTFSWALLASWSLAPYWARAVEPQPVLDATDQTSAEPALEIEEIVISAPSDQVTGPTVMKIAREEIQILGARTLSDVLAVQPAIQSITGGRGERTLLLHGFDQRQTLLLLDSTPFFIPYDGQVDLNVIPAEMIDHVTVIKGPSSVLFGPTGLGGAVNVVTRRPGPRPTLQTSFEANQEGGMDLRSVTSFQTGSLGVLLGGTVNKSPGYRLSSSFKPVFLENGGLRNNSDRENEDLFGNMRWDIQANHHLTFGGFFLSAVKGVPPSILSSQARFWRFTDWTAAGASIGHEGRFDFGLETDEILFVRWFDNLIDSYDDDRYLTQNLASRAFHSWYHDRLYGGRIRAQTKFPKTPWGETLLRLWSNAQLDTHFEDWASGNQMRISRALWTLSPEAQAILSESVTLTISLQSEIEFPGNMPAESTGTKVEVNPMLSLFYEPMPRLSLSATAARRSRFPSLKERFSSSLGLTQPNPSLGPENAWHFSVNGAWEALSHLSIQAEIFDAEVNGLIGQQSIGNGLAQMKNLGTSRLMGAESALTANPWPWLTASLGYAYLYARRTDLDPPNHQLPDRPDHKLTLQIILEPLPRFELSALFQLVGPTPFQNPDTSLWGSLGVYTLLDARVAYHLDHGSTLWIRATNVLDLDYQGKFGFPEPGFELFLGFQTGLGDRP